MMRSLYSAVSGLQVHQTLMDVLSNNISNVNTTGYKKATVTFSDMLSQTIQGAQAGSASIGGKNSRQIGIGVQTGSINNVQTQGAPSTTGNSTDLMIQGEGYFILTDGTSQYYTRAGAFTLDDQGNLVNSGNGMKLCDSAETAINLGPGAGNISISSNGTISYTDDTGAVVTTGNPVIGLATFTNPAGLMKVGENMYVASSSSGTATPKTPGTESGTLIAGSLEMSNVDLAQEFVNMIVAERGFQANSKSIQTTDSMLEQLINIKR